jgi:hypothetical protein
VPNTHHWWCDPLRLLRTAADARQRLQHRLRVQTVDSEVVPSVNAGPIAIGVFGVKDICVCVYLCVSSSSSFVCSFISFSMFSKKRRMSESVKVDRCECGSSDEKRLPCKSTSRGWFSPAIRNSSDGATCSKSICVDCYTTQTRDALGRHLPKGFCIMCNLGWQYAAKLFLRQLDAAVRAPSVSSPLS